MSTTETQIKILNQRILELEARIEELEETISQQDTNQLINTHNEPDELLADAARCIAEEQKASASMLQRRLNIGYAHAARLIDQLEEAGFIGPAKGSSPRDVNITLDDLE